MRLRRLPTAALLALLVLPGASTAQENPAPPLTVPERTDFVETSRYADVVAFLEDLDASSDLAHLVTMGYTTEGRAIPMLVIGRVDAGTPQAVRDSGLLRVYLQGNIHGGEVPGKEALQMLAREILSGPPPAWLDRMVLLIAPIYNADGNERVALDNRPRQHGPIGGMGQRPNAQGFDLNRDHMKLDSPEARSVVAMMTAWDPHVSVDLHTTNGTRHAYHLTYSPPLHPGTDPGIDGLLREVAFPRITRRILESDGEAFHHYGNASRRDGEMGWYTFDHRPRFNNNYIGLRDRIAILSEAYAYATFRERVHSTRRFVEEILDWVHDDADLIREVLAEAERPVTGEELPLRAIPLGADTLSSILMGEVVEERHPFTGETILRRVDIVHPTPMREYTAFEGTTFETVPAEYLIPADAEVVIERLLAHGFDPVWIEPGTTLAGERFVTDSVVASPREFQGHVEQRWEGAWAPSEWRFDEGGWRVSTDGPLGRLAFYLLEPRSDDGLAAWNLVEGAAASGEWPVGRMPAGG